MHNAQETPRPIEEIMGDLDSLIAKMAAGQPRDERREIQHELNEILTEALAVIKEIIRKEKTMPLFFENWDDFWKQALEDDSLYDRAHDEGFYLNNLWYEHGGHSHIDERGPCDGEIWECENGRFVCDLCRQELAAFSSEDGGSYHYPSMWSESKVEGIVGHIESAQHRPDGRLCAECLGEEEAEED